VRGPELKPHYLQKERRKGERGRVGGVREGRGREREGKRKREYE
jgi:hypothetical protein